MYNITRRNFLKNLFVSGCSIILPGKVAFSTSKYGGKISNRVIVGNVLDKLKLKDLIQNSIQNLTGTSNIKNAINSLFKSDDIIGIKLNCIGGKLLCSDYDIVFTIVDILLKSGFSKNQIIIWDRSQRELINAGFKTSDLKDNVRIIGTDHPEYGYSANIINAGSIGSCFSNILLNNITAIINVPILKDHDLAGVTIGMKNFFGAIHNPNKYHDNNCNPYIADLCNHKIIKEKLKLTICSSLKVQYHGGPGYKEQYCSQENKILLSRDPVALDRIGLKIIEDLRQKHNLKSLKEEKRYPDYIHYASRLGLGESDLGRIRVVTI